MKKQILALALVLSAISLTFANNTPSASTLMLSPDETSFILDLTAFQGDVNHVSIIDADGNFIFSDKVESNNQRTKYILDKLQAGTYTVKIKGDKTVEYYTLSLDKDAVSLVEKETFSSPLIVKEANKITVQSTNASLTDLSFSVIDNNGNVIYRNDGFSQKTFNLKELESGEYKVLIRDNEFSEALFVSL